MFGTVGNAPAQTRASPSETDAHEVVLPAGFSPGTRRQDLPGVGLAPVGGG